MAYKLFDKYGNLVTLIDLQDKGPWYEIGASFEKVFIDKYGKALGLIINPEKKKNKYAIDLLNLNTKRPGDLKTQNSPFFQALNKYSIDPQYAVTFNEKDYLRYLKFYTDVEIYFWVKWLITKFESDTVIEVDPMEGVWTITLNDLKSLIITAPLHHYQQRIFDNNGNNKRSYVLDLNNPLFKKVI